MSVAITLEMPTEAKLHLNPPITPPGAGCINTEACPSHSRPDYGCYDSKCKLLIPSMALFAVQSGHNTTEAVGHFIQSNEKAFGGLCNGPFQSHCASMRMAAAFGTQAELQAAPSLFQVPVYILHKCSQERGWEWMRYKPYNKECLN